ncbi:CP2G1 protein, partial [Campylorhamphus procurvoides]|nr:CP2G1 protein [Campylorhamphus procurvoides]
RQLRRFSLSVLRDFGMGKRSIESRIQEEAQMLLQEFRDTRGQPFDPTFKLSCAVSNIICSIVFGNRFDYRDPEFLELLGMMNESFRHMSTPWGQVGEFGDIWGHLRGFWGHSGGFGGHLGEFRGDLGGQFDYRDPTFLELLEMRNESSGSSARPGRRELSTPWAQEKEDPNSEFTLENLELTVLNLFFAGTETVSSTLRFGLLFLMKHPEVEAKVYEEIERVVGPSRPPAVSDRAHMPFTEATIHEIQRCSDLIPMNVPHRVTRDTEFRGYLIPKVRGTPKSTQNTPKIH